MSLLAGDMRRGVVLLNARSTCYPGRWPSHATIKVRIESMDTNVNPSMALTPSPQSASTQHTQYQISQHLVFYTPLTNDVGARGLPERVRVSPEGGNREGE